MALLSLIAKLGIDTSGFQSGIKDAEAKAKTSSTSMRQQFNRIFTAGVAGFSVMSIGRAAIAATRDVEGLAKELERVGRSLTEIEAETLRRAGQTNVATASEAKKQLGLTLADLQDVYFNYFAFPVQSLVSAISDATVGTKHTEAVMRQWMDYNQGPAVDPQSPDAAANLEKRRNEGREAIEKIREDLRGKTEKERIESLPALYRLREIEQRMFTIGMRAPFATSAKGMGAFSSELGELSKEAAQITGGGQLDFSNQEVRDILKAIAENSKATVNELQKQEGVSF